MLGFSSPNASFGDAYPPRSDLTPICTFYYRSLEEFIRNNYQGPYVTVHEIRANDKAAWEKLKLFENCGQGFQFDTLPQTANGEDAELHFTFVVMDISASITKKLEPTKTIRVKILPLQQVGGGR